MNTSMHACINVYPCMYVKTGGHIETERKREDKSKRGEGVQRLSLLIKQIWCYDVAEC